MGLCRDTTDPATGMHDVEYGARRTCIVVGQDALLAPSHLSRQNIPYPHQDRLEACRSRDRSETQIEEDCLSYCSCISPSHPRFDPCLQLSLTRSPVPPRRSQELSTLFAPLATRWTLLSRADPVNTVRQEASYTFIWLQGALSKPFPSSISGGATPAHTASNEVHTQGFLHMAHNTIA